ncbi:MAG: ABC transporter ATP-binding protein [Geminicoccaceae bacterium]|nr:ABC transporter ATP-binding protein [Geminicoccaceae bacterium]MCB9944316.1 ABC transporter ATP-binding protein [Geminicoccaceae bacterium]
MAELVLDTVCKTYDPRSRHPVMAVDHVDMPIKDGEIVGLLGSSGCGKTSTLRMIAGFESVTSGEIRLGERVINTLPPASRNVAMAFEGYALYPPLRIKDNIGFALLRDRRPKAEVAAKVDEVADLLEIDDILDRFPPTISAGQQQRTSLARALIRDADAYLLDEPMSQLEPQLRAILRARIKDWLITRKMTTVFVTHDQTEAIALADRIAVMEKGVLQQFATPSQLKERPANLFVASFIGEPPMNIYEAKVRKDGELLQLVAIDQGSEAFRVPLPARDQAPEAHSGLHDGQEVYLGVRPHKVQLGGQDGLQGKVVSHHWLGDQTHIGIEFGRSLLIAVAHGMFEAPAGSSIGVELPASALHVFDRNSEAALFHGMMPADRTP